MVLERHSSPNVHVDWHCLHSTELLVERSWSVESLQSLKHSQSTVSGELVDTVVSGHESQEIEHSVSGQKMVLEVHDVESPEHDMLSVPVILPLRMVLPLQLASSHCNVTSLVVEYAETRLSSNAMAVDTSICREPPFCGAKAWRDRVSPFIETTTAEQFLVYTVASEHAPLVWQ